MKKSSSKNWEKIYFEGKQLNRYPYDFVVSFVFRKFSAVPLAERKKVKILDLGCGAGNNAKFLAENGFSVYGVDCSETVIKICKKRFKGLRLEGKFIKCEFTKLPFKDNYFDLIIDRESLYANYLSDINKTVKEVYRVLKNDGELLSLMYNNFHPDIKLGKNVEDNTFRNFSEKSTFHQTGIVHFITQQEIKKVFFQFKIKNIMRHSLKGVFNKKNNFMEFDEYIIIAKK